MTPRHWFSRCLDVFVRPSAIGSPEERRRARFAIGIAIAITPVMAALSITQFLWDNPEGGVGSAVIGLVLGAAPFLYRRFGGLERLVHAVLACAWFALCYIAISSRGAGINAASVGLAELPLFAVLLTGMRGGMAWAAICVVTEIGLAVLGRAGTLVELIPPHALVYVEYSSLLLITLTLFAVGAMYELRRKQALAEVAEQDRALREAAHRQALAETDARMAHAEKLASIGRVTAAVAHEINNPLSCLAMNLRFIREDMEGGNYAEDELALALAESIDGVSRIANLVARLSGYARRDPAAEQGTTRLEVALDRAIDLTEPHTRGRAEVVREVEELPPALGQESALVDVFVNLIVNAAQALPEDAARQNRIVVRAARRDPWLMVEVEDNGAGIPADVLPRCGEPFFTTKPIGEATGLGLAVSKAAVRAVGGKLELESRPGRTIARVLLPVADSIERAIMEPAGEKEALEPGAVGPIAPGLSGLRILIVDDDERVARSLQRVLSAHEVITVSSGADALALLRRRADFDLILCDLMMPGMTGMELYGEMATEYPELTGRVIFVTGGAFTAGAREFVDRHAGRVLGKPVSVEALTRVLLAAAGGRPAAS